MPFIPLLDPLLVPGAGPARFCVCPIGGDGSGRSPQNPLGNPFRVGGVEGLNHVAVIPSYPEGHAEQGKPRNAWALVLAGGLPVDPQVQVLPAVPLDLPLGTADLVATQAVLTARGVSTAGVVTLRDAVRALGLKLDPSFDERKMVVG